MIIIYIIIIICSCQGNIYKQMCLSQKRNRKYFRLRHNCVCELYSDLNHLIFRSVQTFPRRAERGFGRFVGNRGLFWRKMGRSPTKICQKYTISRANITIYLARNFVKPLAKANDLYYNIVKWSESGEKKIESTSRSQEILRKRR